MKIFLGAVVDGDFLTDTAEELLKKNEVLKVPVMMGITNHEFGWILPQVGGDVLLFACSWIRAGWSGAVLAELRPPRLGPGHDQRVCAGGGEHVQPGGGERLQAAVVQNQDRV